jgi:hypothetical protein
MRREQSRLFLSSASQLPFDVILSAAKDLCTLRLEVMLRALLGTQITLRRIDRHDQGDLLHPQAIPCPDLLPAAGQHASGKF